MGLNSAFKGLILFNLHSELDIHVCHCGCEENLLAPLFNEMKLQITHLHICINGLVYTMLYLKLAVQIPDIMHQSLAFSKI
jgi:hypothetical protein